MEWKIPGFGNIEITAIVSDYNGTLAVNGKLIPGIADQIIALSKRYTVHVLTGDTYGIAAEQLDGLPCELHILPKEDQAVAKKRFVEELGSQHCIAVGNGRNDGLMLKAAEIGIGVIQQEGAAVDALMHADLVVNNINDAFSIIKDEKRLIATLRS